MMLSKGLLVLWVACLMVALSQAKSDRCNLNDSASSNELDKDCNSSEYTSYVDCVRKRSKRHIDCNNSCDGGGDDCEANEDCGQCDCNYCSYNECDTNCSSCCSGYEAPCQTRTCCHATCQSTCRTSSCRRGCRSRCHKTIEKNSGGGGGGGGGGGTTHYTHHAGAISTNQQSHTSNQAKHNITTVINLKTVVNNTNIVDMPIRVNNTNLNNITLESPQPGDINVNMQTHPGSTVIQSHPPTYAQPPQPPQPPQYYPQQCCNIISPRQCVPTQEPPYQNCYHTKSKVCGEVCTSSVMHAEPHRVCDQQESHHQQASSCHEQVAYIPQPQPRCFSTSQWPYVNCMVAKPSCGGCYTHLVQGGSAPSHCPNSCYDSGINVGPYYQPGPTYQPGYNSYPTNCGSGGCYNTGYNIGAGGGGGGGGGVGVGDSMNTWGLQSLGPYFGDGPQNVTVMQNTIPDAQKYKRHLHEGHHLDKEMSSEDDSLEYKVEEYPIKMD